MTTQPTLVTVDEQYANTGSCQYSAQEAAAKLGVSVSTIRRQCKSLGVTRLSGPTVAAFVAWPHSHGSLPVYLPVAAVQS